MKKLALLVASFSLAVVAPAFACPHDDAAPKTADKAKAPAKDDKAPAKDDKAKEAPKTETAKAKDAPKKDEPKKPEKVSQK
jgi:hypothetical protein